MYISYRIAGNFQKRKFSRILQFNSHLQSFLHEMLGRLPTIDSAFYESFLCKVPTSHTHIKSWEFPWYTIQQEIFKGFHNIFMSK